jgi:hypothetical protein
MDFGEITKEIAKATGGKMQKAPVRLQVGNKKFGYIHLLKHKEQMRQKGYNNPLDYIQHVLDNFTRVYKQSNGSNKRFVLYCTDESKGFMPVDLELKSNSDGFYTIISVMPHKDNIKGTLLFDGSANPSAATANGTLLEESNNKGGVTTSPNTHAKSNVPIDSSIPQPKENIQQK